MGQNHPIQKEISQFLPHDSAPFPAKDVEKKQIIPRIPRRNPLHSTVPMKSTHSMPYTSKMTLKSLLCSLQELDNPKYCDMQLIVGLEAEEFSVNRTMFARISDFFATCCKETSIELRDISPEVFECLYRYAYGKDPLISFNNLVSVRSACHRYGVWDLMESCDKFFDSCVRPYNVCYVWDDAIRLNDSYFLEKCHEFLDEKDDVWIRSRHLQVVMSQAFLAMNPASMLDFLERDFLLVNEETLFLHVLKWAEARARVEKCCVLQVLTPIKSLIRFPLMGEKFLRTTVRSTKLLDEDEIMLIVLSQKDPSMPPIFNSSLRDGGASVAEMKRSPHISHKSFNSKMDTVPGYRVMAEDISFEELRWKEMQERENLMQSQFMEPCVEEDEKKAEILPSKTKTCRREQCSQMMSYLKHMTLEKLLSTFEALDKPELCDITFVVGAEKQEFPANRTMFARISGVLKNCLYGHWKESKPNALIPLPSVTPETFEVLYNHAYGRDPKISCKNLVSVRKMCHSYDVSDLMAFCDDYFFDSCALGSMYHDLDLEVTDAMLFDHVLKWAETRANNGACFQYKLLTQMKDQISLANKHHSPSSHMPQILCQTYSTPKPWRKKDGKFFVTKAVHKSSICQVIHGIRVRNHPFLARVCIKVNDSSWYLSMEEESEAFKAFLVRDEDFILLSKGDVFRVVFSCVIPERLRGLPRAEEMAVERFELLYQQWIA